jgi:hypothetical protein
LAEIFYLKDFQRKKLPPETKPEKTWDEYNRLMMVFNKTEDPREAADAYREARVIEDSLGSQA